MKVVLDGLIIPCHLCGAQVRWATTSIQGRRFLVEANPAGPILVEGDDYARYQDHERSCGKRSLLRRQRRKRRRLFPF